MKELGYENTSVLQGGFVGFKNIILQPSTFASTGTRWDSDVQKFRERARAEILQLIEQSKNATPVVKKEKKIQGGC